MASYNEDTKKKIVQLHLEESRSLKSLSEEFSVSKSGISNWVKKHRVECRTITEAKEEYDLMAESLRLLKQLEEMEKDNRFFKKWRHSLRRKSISGVSVYSK